MFSSHRQTYTCTDCYQILPRLVSFWSTPPGIALALPILSVSRVSRRMLHIISHMICVFLRRSPIWKCDDGKLPSLALSSGPVMEGIRIGLVPPQVFSMPLLDWDASPLHMPRSQSMDSSAPPSTSLVVALLDLGRLSGPEGPWTSSCICPAFT